MCACVYPAVSSLSIKLSLSLLPPSPPLHVVTALTFLPVCLCVLSLQAEEDRCLIGFLNRKRLQARATADELDDGVEKWLWSEFSAVSPSPRIDKSDVYFIEKKGDKEPIFELECL